MADLFENLMIFQFVTELIKATLGAGLCFGALKWRRGLLTTTSIGWGAVLGVAMGYFIGSTSGGSIELVLICAVIGALIFPILTYCVAGVNRFVLGFLVGSKLFVMFTTVMLKEGNMDIDIAIVLPLIAGTIIGLVLMAWTQMRVSAVVISCSFIGASDIAPIISEWYNRVMYTTTGNISYLFDPVDLLFALFKIELTDKVTLISLIILLVLGCRYQLKRLRKMGISYSTPLIGFEVPRDKNGEINN